MTKRLIEIDDALLAAAKAALGTSGSTDTVVASLTKIVEDDGYAERKAHIHELMLRFVDATDDLRDPEVMKGAWKI